MNVKTAIEGLRAVRMCFFAVLITAACAAHALAADVREGMQLLENPDPQSVGRAEEIFQWALAANPDDAQARMGLVYSRLIVYLTTGQKDPALLEAGLREVDAVLKSNPLLEDAWYKRSQILYFLGRVDEGLENLRSGLRQVPQSLNLHEALLVYLLNSERFGEAVVFSRRPEPAVKDMGTLHLRLGLAWMKAGRPLEARENFLAANRVTPSREASDAITRTFVVVGDDTGAMKHLQEHLKVYAEDLDALQSLAMIHEEQGDRVNARLCWTKFRAQTSDPALRDLATEHIKELSIPQQRD